MVARRLAVLLFAVAALIAASITSLALGAVSVPFGEATAIVGSEFTRGIAKITGDGFVQFFGITVGTPPDTPNEQIVGVLRLPRLIEGILVGAALGVAGAVLQGALNNPLASPDVIGVTAGAGFGAVLIILAFPASIALLPVGALAFGLLAAALVFIVAWSGRNPGNVNRVILAGIAIAAMFGAGTTAVMTANAEAASSVIFFLAGGLTSDGWLDLKTIWPYFLAGFIVAACVVRPLDKLALGDDVAASLGSRPRVTRLMSGLAAALLASASAALAGLLSFLGLVVPHVVRMAAGTSSHSYVVPVSAIGGAALLVAADTFARVVAAPVELPVGPFIVILGVPLFLWLLRKAN